MTKRVEIDYIIDLYKGSQFCKPDSDNNIHFNPTLGLVFNDEDPIMSVKIAGSGSPKRKGGGGGGGLYGK